MGTLGSVEYVLHVQFTQTITQSDTMYCEGSYSSTGCTVQVDAWRWLLNRYLCTQQA